MYSIHIIKADYEGWWLFPEWRENIIYSESFDHREEMKCKYDDIHDEMQKRFRGFVTGKQDMPAFFNCCEVEYCEDCDEDKQIYYSIIVTKADEVVLDSDIYKNLGKS